MDHQGFMEVLLATYNLKNVYLKLKSQQEGVKHMDSIILCTDNRRESNEYEPLYTFKQRNPLAIIARALKYKPSVLI